MFGNNRFLPLNSEGIEDGDVAGTGIERNSDTEKRKFFFLFHSWGKNVCMESDVTLNK